MKYLNPIFYDIIFVWIRRGENMEENLIKRSKEGDKDAFAKLIELYERKLFVIAKSRLDQDEDIKDGKKKNKKTYNLF